MVFKVIAVCGLPGSLCPHPLNPGVIPPEPSCVCSGLACLFCLSVTWFWGTRGYMGGIFSISHMQLSSILSVRPTVVVLTLESPGLGPFLGPAFVIVWFLALHLARLPQLCTRSCKLLFCLSDTSVCSSRLYLMCQPRITSYSRLRHAHKKFPVLDLFSECCGSIHPST